MGEEGGGRGEGRGARLLGSGSADLILLGFTRFVLGFLLGFY